MTMASFDFKKLDGTAVGYGKGISFRKATWWAHDLAEEHEATVQIFEDGELMGEVSPDARQQAKERTAKRLAEELLGRPK